MGFFAGVRRRCGHYSDWCRRGIARHRTAAVLAGTGAAFGCGLTTAVTNPPARLSAAELAIAAVTYAVFAAVAVTRRPLWLLVATATAGAVVSMVAGVSYVVVTSALYIAVLVFALAGEFPLVIAGTAAVVAVLSAGHLTFSQHPATGWSDLQVLPCVAVFAAVGLVIRARRMQRAMLAERAAHAEELREADARQRIRERVQEERLRIARELHDAVGHQVALISVQAGAMAYLLGTGQASTEPGSPGQASPGQASPGQASPGQAGPGQRRAGPGSAELDRARESVAHIQRASAAALEELRLTVGLLRQPGDNEPTEPAAGLGSLGELIDSFAAAGLAVTCTVTGQAGPLPESVDFTAYRLIQESLTNTAKHAAGASASVTLTYRPGVLALAVEDDGQAAIAEGGPTATDGSGQAASPSGIGHGLIGMRERAAALGGWVTAGPRDGGGFQVLAELPVPAEQPVPAGLRLPPVPRISASAAS